MVIAGSEDAAAASHRAAPFGRGIEAQAPQMPPEPMLAVYIQLAWHAVSETTSEHALKSRRCSAWSGSNPAATAFRALKAPEFSLSPGASSRDRGDSQTRSRIRDLGARVIEAVEARCFRGRPSHPPSSRSTLLSFFADRWRPRSSSRPNGAFYLCSDCRRLRSVRDGSRVT
jgi:hypothetical protein